MVEWVEVRGKTIDVAVAAAMNELGVDDRAQVDVEVVQEPEKGFLGMGGRDAIVRVKPKPRDRRSRGRDRRPRASRAGSTGSSSEPRRSGGPRNGENTRSGQGGGANQPRRRNGSGQRAGGGNRSGEPRSDEGARFRRTERPPADVNPAEQAPVVENFLNGLVDAFGLEGTVRVDISDDVIVAGIEGDQTEALVGHRGSVMEAVHEITKTVLHRQFRDTARVRIDIAGYAERRRQALSIYAGQLIAQVKSEGGEIMLEPMSAADRKVIHDVVGEVDGIRSYSEGEPPRRYVVISDESEEAEPEATF